MIILNTGIVVSFIIFIFLIQISVFEKYEDIDNESDNFPSENKNNTIFVQRRDLLDEMCQRYLDPFRPESQSLSSSYFAKISDYNYFWFQGKYTMICSIHKVGSNSMHRFLNHILEEYLREAPNVFNGMDLKHHTKEEDEQQNEIIENQDENLKMSLPVYKDCWPDCAEKHTKVILVRHPLERLLSGYLYIFQNDGKFTSYRLPWNEFVDKVIRFDPDPDWQRIQQEVGDHWEPYWKACSVCAPQFRPFYILKLESLKDDLRNYLLEFGLSKYSDRFPWVNPHKGQHGTSLRVLEFYSRLNRSTIEQLYQVYKVDHELFGYSPEPFYNVAYEVFHNN
jgi:hypothetical protein